MKRQLRSWILNRINCDVVTYQCFKICKLAYHWSERLSPLMTSMNETRWKIISLSNGKAEQEQTCWYAEALLWKSILFFNHFAHGPYAHCGVNWMAYNHSLSAGGSQNDLFSTSGELQCTPFLQTVKGKCSTLSWWQVPTQFMPTFCWPWPWSLLLMKSVLQENQFESFF